VETAPLSATNRYTVIPVPSTRICPNFASLADAIVVPFAAALGDGLVLGYANLTESRIELGVRALAEVLAEVSEGVGAGPRSRRRALAPA